MNKLTSKEGLGLVKTFLEEQLVEDELEKQIRTGFEFEDCERANKDKVRAFMVLERANINHLGELVP